ILGPDRIYRNPEKPHPPHMRKVVRMGNYTGVRHESASLRTKAMQLMAATTAVSQRKIVGPSQTGANPAPSKSAVSPAENPPSGPTQTTISSGFVCRYSCNPADPAADS